MKKRRKYFYLVTEPNVRAYESSGAWINETREPVVGSRMPKYKQLYYRDRNKGWTRHKPCEGPPYCLNTSGKVCKEISWLDVKLIVI